MEYFKMTCESFLKELGSKAPVPGGGSASALVGAMGMALGSMVGNLTLGKKAYLAVQEEVQELLQRAEQVQADLLNLLEADIAVFSRLSNAYAFPKDSPENAKLRAEELQEALKKASEVPLAIMQRCCDAIELHELYAQIGTKNAISDVGVGVACCKAALFGASLNIFINLKSIDDLAYKESLEGKTKALLNEYGARADRVFQEVMAALV